MKRLSKILCFTLSMVMVLGTFGTIIACKPDSVKTYTVTYQEIVPATEEQIAAGKSDEIRNYGSFKVKAGSKIDNTQRPVDPFEAGSEMVFDFWAKAGEDTDFIANSNVTDNVTLNAVFRERREGEILFNFDTDGGSYIPTQSLTSGAKATKPADPTRAGFTFSGWLGGYDFDKAVLEDTQIRAEWLGGSGQTLVLNTQNFDGVFSPFFYTSAYDGNITGLTQISMLSANSAGQPYVGEDSPTMVKAFKDTAIINNGGVWSPATTAQIGELKSNEKTDPDKLRTEYEFVIKKGIKDSRGNPMGIEDVLFNLYVYLDPMYTGSTTIYSTNILGLNKYRSQNPAAGETGGTNESASAADALFRLDRLKDFFDKDRLTHNRNTFASDTASGGSFEKEIMDDIYNLRILFWEELVKDWNSVNQLDLSETKNGSGIPYIEGYEDYGFTEKWEVFLYNCGLISVAFDANGIVDKNKDDGGFTDGVNYRGTKDWRHDAESLLKIVFDNKMGILEANEKGSIFQDGAEKPQIDLDITSDFKIVYDDNGNTGIGADKFVKRFGDLTSAADRTTLAKDTFIGRVLQTNISLALTFGLPEILNGWSSGSKLFEQILVRVKSEKFSGLSTTGRLVDRVDGITVGTATGDFEGRDGKITKLGSETYDTLKVTIVGVDPKAIWNFSFSVAPMSYYSDPSARSGTGFSTAADGYLAFKYPGVGANKNVAADDETFVSHLGFKQLNIDYFNKVLRHQAVISVPVGAGSFRATDINGNAIPTGPTFAQDQVVYYRRNENFKTTGEKMNNAKFEFLRYKVVDTAKVLESIGSEIHFGDPSAKQENLTKANNNPDLEVKLVQNNGYGYVGINAGHVPDIKIRRAIMHALDTSLITDYFPGGLSSLVYRSMSKVSEYYPTNSRDAYPFTGIEDTKTVIKKLVSEAGYDGSRYNNKALARVNPQTQSLTDLKFTFVVAGSTIDHPAYNMFTKARDILNACGFNITVKNDAQALSKLSNGELEVWAAAWSATIDPDMYQVYHKDSQAQSVKNWGYPYLLANGTSGMIQGELGEKEQLVNLSKKIDEGRQTLVVEDRKGIYASALDMVMDLAVEYPTYQRENLFVFDKTKIDATTVNKKPTPYLGLIDQLWRISLHY